jgi:hypothetical protein
MIEIIKRREGEKSVKEQISGRWGRVQGVQVSYNDWGHLVVRLIQNDEEDTLVVFNRDISDSIIEFCKKISLGNKDIPF